MKHLTAMSRNIVFVITIFLITLGCVDNEKNIDRIEKEKNAPNNELESTDDKADKDFRNGVYSCYFHYKNVYEGKISSPIERDELLYRLGVCSFHNRSEKYFVLSDQIPNYDNYSFAQEFFSKIRKPVNAQVSNNDGTVSFNNNYKKAQFYLGLLHYYGGMGNVLNDHKKSLDYFLEAKLENDVQSMSIKTDVNFQRVGNGPNANPYVLYGNPAKFIANIYIMDLSVPVDTNKFISYMSEAADDEVMTDAEACYFLGAYYLTERKDEKMSKKYIEKAHNLGFEDAKEFWDENQLYKVKD